MQFERVNMFQNPYEREMRTKKVDLGLIVKSESSLSSGLNKFSNEVDPLEESEDDSDWTM
jgi:hypothetical protein